MPHDCPAWRKCITVDGGIPLKPAYVAKRLSELTQAKAGETPRLPRSDGDEHWRRAIHPWVSHPAVAAQGRPPHRFLRVFSQQPWRV